VTRLFKPKVFHLIDDNSTRGFHPSETQTQSNVSTVNPSLLPVTQLFHSTYFQNQRWPSQA